MIERERFDKEEVMERKLVDMGVNREWDFKRERKGGLIEWKGEGYFIEKVDTGISYTIFWVP